MNNIDFRLYVGGKGSTVNRNGLAIIPTPEPSGRWMPIPHITLVTELEKALTPYNMRVVNETFKIDKGGNRLFGMLQIGNHIEMPDFSFVAGLRNAHDQAVSAGLVVGDGVFVCSNLRFNGEIKIGRKHTTEILNDLPVLMGNAVKQLNDQWDKQTKVIDVYKQTGVTSNDGRNLLIDCAKQEVFPRTQFMDVLHEWEEPKHEEFKERNLWSLMNAVTESLKPREQSTGSTLWLLPIRTERLNGICNRFAGIPVSTLEEA